MKHEIKTYAGNVLGGEGAKPANCIAFRELLHEVLKYQNFGIGINFTFDGF
jgi:hypothetical protein